MKVPVMSRSRRTISAIHQRDVILYVVSVVDEQRLEHAAEKMRKRPERTSAKELANGSHIVLKT